ncbi:MAG: cobalamin biosynthesis protein, partial [Novosphingobium sp.]
MERDAVIVAGFGFRAGAPPESLRAALALALAQRDVPPVTHLATAQDKSAALDPLGQALGLPLVPVSAEAIAAARTITQGDASRRARGTGSLSEAAALAAA